MGQFDFVVNMCQKLTYKRKKDRFFRSKTATGGGRKAFVDFFTKQKYY